eukprot:CAMPEP_0185737358 /NCGR_PEP_ID=MMETSP1171-20130828/30220_1 /TAXON_ID=374046 /ORGANISM="Helicotheca tamensis, Strain CCMP826" /LENGTH=185 /DNA_ID=CAMNT_0028408267 /DNA_START=133 /DNA_END=690 /DNA_ORIENTATION=-
MRSRTPNNLSALFIALVAVATFTSSTSLAFNVPPSLIHKSTTTAPVIANKKAFSPTAPTLLFSTPSEDTEEIAESADETKAVTTADLYPPSQSSSNKAAADVEDTGTSYPVNLPSPILLASSMVLAIASTGSLFELTGGDPQLGFAPTLAIAIVGLPTCLFLFYASILKATAETEEDDKKFTRGQ